MCMSGIAVHGYTYVHTVRLWKIVGKCIEVFGRRWLCFRTEIWNRLGAG